MTTSDYLILGNSTAAVGCVEAIRTIDKTGTITMVSSENYPAYSRPLISYLLEGRTDEKRMMYRDKNFYKKNNIELITGKSATDISASKKTVTLDDGTTLGYKKLLNAIGSRPFVPPMAGLDLLPRWFTFLSLDSAKSLAAVLGKKTHVLIIGAGLIGMKCAEGIADSVGDITIVEMAPRCLPAVLEEKGAAVIQKKMEEHNVSFDFGDSVKTFVPNFPKGTPEGDAAVTYNKVSSSAPGQKSMLGGVAETMNGKKIAFDVLVCAVGVRPNTQLIEKAGGKVEKGIVIDENCRTTLKDVWAAGDCTLSHDMSAGMDRILALLPNAYMQGEAAGLDMAGSPKPFTRAMPLNSAGFFDLHMVTAGSYTGKCIDASHDGYYRKFFVDGDLLKGFIIIGDVNRAGIYTALIRSQTPLSSIDFDAIKDEPRLMAFSKSRREVMLGKEDVPATSWNFATV